jgi:trehalose 6-phosphate phosphatase
VVEGLATPLGDGSAQASWPRVDAAIFDTDGVITRTATLHAAAWKVLFDDFLGEWSARHGVPFEPFTDDDYRRYVDGVPRLDGVARFLGSRGIALPTGAPDDAPGHATVCSLGNRKNEAFLAELDRRGVEPFDTTAAFVRALRSAGVRTAAILASENAAAVLARAGVAELFDERVDGLDAAALRPAGKPDPVDLP